jgi:putative colanic acid biosysnthesis UDP-glucose lipid carrier transferase
MQGFVAETAETFGGAPSVAVARGYKGKREFDLLVAPLLIVITSPLMLVAGILVLLSSPGPVIFRQKRFWMRVAGEEKFFIIWKFRTLHVGSEKPHDLVVKGDPRLISLVIPCGRWRITIPVGKILRDTHFDELLQLFQVFLGTMSLVGPRPDMLEKAHERIRATNGRHRELQQWKPGLVGRVCLMGKWETLERKDPAFDATEVELKYLRDASRLSDLKLLGLAPLKVVGFPVHRWLS